jgi:hypothetical protein
MMKQAEDDESDRRVLMFIIGGLLLAFTIGVVILIVAAMTDWQR